MGPAVIITGAAGGIGAALCARMKRDGFWTIGIDRRPSKAADESFEIDMVESERLRQFAIDVCARRPLKAIVHNAALQPVGRAGEIDLSDWFAALRVNVIAVDSLLAGAIGPLTDARGSVVVISSVHARSTSGGVTAYATTKAALEGWVRSAAIDHGPSIRINAVAPGAIDTAKLREGFARWGNVGAEDRKEILRQRTALRRIGEPEEVAAAVSFLIGDDARFITGSVLTVDGGASARLGSE